jgi:hypothetical protein
MTDIGHDQSHRFPGADFRHESLKDLMIGLV